MSKPKLPRITEPDYGPDMVHFGPYPGADAVTLCNLTDWIGATPGKPTRKSVTCRVCLSIVRYVHAHEEPRAALRQKEGKA